MTQFLDMTHFLDAVHRGATCEATMPGAGNQDMKPI